jgi:UrcA family protein
MYSKEMNVTKSLQIVWGMVASMAIAWGGGNTAQAGEPDNAVPHKVVSFRDLNLNSAEGVEVLYKRIRSAAHEVCADPLRYDLSESKLKPCIDEAMSRAIAQINSPMLTGLYESKSGKAGKKATTVAQVR